MMRISILFMCFIPLNTWACPLDDFLRSALFSPRVQPVRMSAATVKINAPYSKFYFKPRMRRIQVYKGSLAEKTPGLIQKLDELDQNIMFYDDFANEYRKVYRRDPTPQDTKEFLQSRNEIFKNQTSEWVKEIESIAPQHITSLKRQIDEISEENLTSIHSIFSNSSEAEVRTQTAAIGKRVAGLSTEMRALASLPHIKHFSKRLNELDEFSGVIERRFKDIRENLNENPMLIESLRSKYPRIFMHRRILRNTNIASDYLVECEKWIGSKEVDFLREEAGNIRWIELKANGEKFDPGTLPMNQIKEYKQIIDFLGLDGKIKLEYLATGGMTDGTKRILQSMGVRVIDPL